MRSSHSINPKKGFTLIEILLVITIVAILGVAALSAYFGSAGTFDFLGEYKIFASNIRTARLYAVNNKNLDVEVGGELMQYDRYGLYIEPDEVTLFADNKNSAFEFTPAGDGVSEEEEDYIFPDKYMCLGEISGGNCVSPEYQLDLDYHGEDVLPLPVVLFYENGTGNFKAFVDDNGDYLPISKHDYRQLVFRFSETDGDQLEKYLVIFQVSGLPEEIKNEADILN